MEHFEEWAPLVIQVLSMTQNVMPLPVFVKDVLAGYYRQRMRFKLFKLLTKKWMPVATVMSEAEVSAYISQFPTIPWVLPVATVVPEVGSAADVPMASLSSGLTNSLYH